MKCSICGKEEVSTCERPITLGGLGHAKTQPICDNCYSKKIEIVFSKDYSDEEREDIASFFGGESKVRLSKHLIFQKAAHPPLLIAITLVVGSLYHLLKSFTEETGKLLAQKMFSPSKKNERQLNLRIEYENSQGEKRSVQIIADNWQECYEKMKELNQRSKEE